VVKQEIKKTATIIIEEGRNFKYLSSTNVAAFVLQGFHKTKNNNKNK